MENGVASLTAIAQKSEVDTVVNISTLLSLRHQIAVTRRQVERRTMDYYRLYAVEVECNSIGRYGRLDQNINSHKASSY